MLRMRVWHIVVAVVAPWLLIAQSLRSGGQYGGVVMDSAGGVVPTALVRVDHLSTGATRRAVAADDGRFQRAGLPIGEYRIRRPPLGSRLGK
jgi:hypothetical protein